MLGEEKQEIRNEEVTPWTRGSVSTFPGHHGPSVLEHWGRMRDQTCFQPKEPERALSGQRKLKSEFSGRFSAITRLPFTEGVGPPACVCVSHVPPEGLLWPHATSKPGANGAGGCAGPGRAGGPSGQVDSKRESATTLVKNKPSFEIIAATRRSCVEASACPQGLGTALGPKEGTFRLREEAACFCGGPLSVLAPTWRERGQHFQQ